MDHLDQRLGRLVERVLEGGVLPFLGAGVSYGAGHRERGWTSSPRRMPGLLSGALEEVLRVRECRYRAARCPDPAATASDAACATLCELFLKAEHSGSLSWLAELGTLLWGHVRVCEVAEIAEYARLLPLPFHRFLAYLAREGLITEVLTTNYDCCLETAYRDTFGRERPDDRAPAVIRCLEEYRALGNQRFWEHSDRLSRTELHVYKINGCAEHYRQARDQAQRFPSRESRCAWAEAAARIVLTERQLQDFRGERWAEDLFRDRARSRNLLFCGFGSEEPQIRHTAVTLMREFQAGQGPCRSMTLDQAADQPNAPFVAVHGHALSFYQLQILAAYMDAHTRRDGHGDSVECRVEPLLKNVFLGPDACALEVCGPEGLVSAAGPGAKARLDAGLFAQALWERVVCGLVERETGDGTPFVGWLRWHTPRFRPWVGVVRDALGGRREPRSRSCPVSRCELLGPPSADRHFPRRLWAWLWAMCHPEDRDPLPDDWYLPVTEDPILVLTTLMLLRVLTAPAGRSAPLEGTVYARPPHGLEVLMPRDEERPPLLLYLVAETAAGGRSGDSQRGRLLRCISVPSLRYFVSIERWVERSPPPAPGGVDRLRVGRRETVSAGLLVQAAGTPERLSEVLPRVLAAGRRQTRARLNPHNSSPARGATPP